MSPVFEKTVTNNVGLFQTVNQGGGDDACIRKHGCTASDHDPRCPEGGGSSGSGDGKGRKSAEVKTKPPRHPSVHSGAHGSGADVGRVLEAPAKPIQWGIETWGADW